MCLQCSPAWTQARDSGCHSSTARLITTWPRAAHSLLTHCFSLSTCSSKTNTISVRWFCVVLVIFWANACLTPYEFVVVNGQTTTYCILQGSVATTAFTYYIIAIYTKFLLDVPCQKLLKLASVLRSYSKTKNVIRFLRHGVLVVVVVCFRVAVYFLLL